MVDFDLNAQKLSTSWLVFLMTLGFIFSFWYTFESLSPREAIISATLPRPISEKNIPLESPEDRITMYSKHLTQGQNYLKTQQFEAAEKALESALEILDSTEVRRSLSESRFLKEKQLAEEALRLEQFETAVLHLKKALSYQDHEALREKLSQYELKLQTQKLEKQNKEERLFWLNRAREATQKKLWEEALSAYTRVQAFGNLEENIVQEIQTLQQTLETRAEEERFQKSWEHAQSLTRQDWQNGLVFLAQLQKQFPQKKIDIVLYRESIIQEKLTELMVEIPRGSYLIGSDASEDERPIHRVTLDRFKIDQIPVTHWQYALFIHETGYPAPNYWIESIYPAGQEWFPVVQVNFDDATAFARWAKKRLPTEIEWEAAARTTEGSIYPWGNALEKKRSNHRDSNFQGVCAVKQFPPNPYGLYDLVGNVSQWTNSIYDAYPGNKTLVSESGQNFRSIRGGSFLLTIEHLRCANRFYETPQARLPSLGFRCARSIP